MNMMYVLIACYGMATNNLVCQDKEVFSKPEECIQVAKTEDAVDFSKMWMCEVRAGKRRE